jgi:hypothetical protein
MQEPDTIAERLSVPHLQRLWQRVVAPTDNARLVSASDWAADQALIYGLGLGLHETFAFLHAETPSFASFQNWVLERNGGSVDTARVAQVNSAVARARGEEASSAGGLPADFAPVFDESDLRCWDANGYVVLRAAVPLDACRAAEQAIWDFIGADRDDPDTWYGGRNCEGIFVTLVHHPAFGKNRRSPRVRNAFAQLWGTDDLAVIVDRGGFNPPERPGWRFSGPGLHWDTSLLLPLPFDVQGVLYLTDTPAEQGAFRCVPGFHRRIGDWLAGLPEGADPRAQDLSAEAVFVGGKAGDVVIWRSALPHAASPNRGERPRLVQYLTYRPAGRVDNRPWV